MAKIDSALWRDIMEYLRQRHAPICRQWFEELEPLHLNGGLMTVQTTNAVQQAYLQRKCRDQFTEAAQSATGALIAVRFVTEEDDIARVAADEAEVVASAAVGSAGAAVAPRSVAAGGASRTVAGASGAARASGPEGLGVSGSSGGTSGGASGGGRAAPISRSDAMFDDEMVLSPDYSFENFVTGPGNDMAYAAAVAVANQPGTAYNPLFIHGGVGLGKTHLLQAICQQVLHNNRNAQICYLSCETFMNLFLDCVQRGQMNEFRHRYRSVDLLVIDDIHFLANRDRTQEEFFHTFNALYQSNRQIVLSSDRPPSEIPQLEERLVSRFGWGLVTTVSKPDYETRLAIVRAKAKLRGLVLPDDVASYIANRIDSNARELEGAITTVQGNAALKNKAVDLALAQQALGDPVVHAGRSQITLQNIIDAVTGFYNVRLSDLQSKRRHKSITEPRQVCMWLARRKTRFSLEEIGGHFGGRDHTTVMHSIRTVDDRMSSDESFSRQITALDEKITANNGGA